MTENDFRKLFVQRYGSLPDFRIYISNVGGVPVRSSTGKQLGFFRSGLPDGWPDCTGFHIGSGRLIALELKGPKTAHPKHQQQFGAFMRSAGCIYAFYRMSEELSIEENLVAAYAALREAMSHV